MMEDINTVLDYIQNIKVKGNPFVEPANEYWALICLKRGLDFLNSQIEKIEQSFVKVLDPKKQILISGSALPKEIPVQLLTCAFQWYSVSACQYVGTIGTIAYLEDNTRPIPPEYIKLVIPDVLIYRDKVGAHFAWTKNNNWDNDAERLASIIPQITWSIDSFQVQGFTISLQKKGISSNSVKLTPWSITKIHKLLRKRYWPEEIEV